MKHLGLRVAARVTIVWTSGPLACPAIGLSRRVEATFLAACYAHLALFHTTEAGLSDPHRRELPRSGSRRYAAAARLDENHAASCHLA